MIGKMTKGASASGLVNYLLQPKQNAVIIGAEGISIVTKHGIINGFDMHIQELGREDVKQPIGHVSLSWSPDDRDKLSDDLMLQVAREYMREMGIVDVPHVIVQHNCTGHPHLHIAYSRVSYDGKVLKSSNDFRRNARVCRMLTKKYDSKMGSKRGKREFKNLRGAEERLQNMRIKVHKAYENSHDWWQFNRRLAILGIGLSFRMSRQKNSIAGVVFSDKMMSVPGSKISYTLSLKSIDDLFGGELQQATLNVSAALNNSFILAFDTAMQLIAQPNVVQTSGGGGGSSDTETADEKKRRKLEAEAAQAQHSQNVQQIQQQSQPKPTYRRGRR